MRLDLDNLPADTSLLQQLLRDLADVVDQPLPGGVRREVTHDAIDRAPDLGDLQPFHRFDDMLGRLEAKGLVRHHAVDQTYVYKSVVQPAKVRESAMRQMVRTFFDGSAASAATALLGLSQSLNEQELVALQRAIDEAKERQS